MDRPIVPLQIRRAFEGRVFSVVVESVTLPRGHHLDVEIVRHPGSVVLVPVTDAGKIVLVRQYRHAVGRSLWELPAGTLKPGEEPRAAAMRECQEEIGLIPSRVERLGALYPSPGFCDEDMTFFAATGLRTPGVGDEKAEPDADEDIETQAFAVDAIQRMISAGDVIDMKTVAGLALLPRA